MRVLPFKISNQQIVKDGDFTHITKGIKTICNVNLNSRILKIGMDVRL
jgi:hypothetical protein